MIKRLAVALSIGLAVSSLPWLLRNYDVLAPIQLLMIPGAILAAILAGNIHAYSLTVVVLANMGFYALPIYFYLRHRAKPPAAPSDLITK